MFLVKISNIKILVPAKILDSCIISVSRSDSHMQSRVHSSISKNYSNFVNYYDYMG